MLRGHLLFLAQILETIEPATKFSMTYMGVAKVDISNGRYWAAAVSDECQLLADSCQSFHRQHAVVNCAGMRLKPVLFFRAVLIIELAVLDRGGWVKVYPSAAICM